MENFEEIKLRFQALAERIDKMVEGETKSLPDGIHVGTVGEWGMSDFVDIPKGKHIGFLFIIDGAKVKKSFIG